MAETNDYKYYNICGHCRDRIRHLKMEKERKATFYMSDE